MSKHLNLWLTFPVIFLVERFAAKESLTISLFFRDSLSLIINLLKIKSSVNPLLSRLALKIVVMARQEAIGNRQE